MPRELTALMIRTSGNPDALRPTMVQVPLSVTTSCTDEILAEVEAVHPQSRATSATGKDDGAMLTATQALDLLNGWRTRLNKGKLEIASGYMLEQEIDELVVLAKHGHAMILMVH